MAKDAGSKSHVHEVTFVTYPKLLFIWPLLIAGVLFFYPAKWAEPTTTTATPAAEVQPAVDSDVAPAPGRPNYSTRLETLGWIYLFILFLVILTLGVDVDRNQAVFWVVVILLIWIGGRYLAEVKGFTLLGNIYNWFDRMDVQYDRALGLATSIVLLVPYLLMIGWSYLNDRWRISHNEFEHYAFGKMDDSLGRGAKTIRTSYPDVLEMILGMAGTLIVYNATGTKELRRIPHVLFLPWVRGRLNIILERTAITAELTEEEEDDDEA